MTAHSAPEQAARRGRRTRADDATGGAPSSQRSRLAPVAPLNNNGRRRRLASDLRRPPSGVTARWASAAADRCLSPGRLLLVISLLGAAYLAAHSHLLVSGRQESPPEASAHLPPGGPNQARVPYKSFHVTRACEWKSNLYVPKSNDVHFAQPPHQSIGEQQAPGVAESSVLYEYAGQVRAQQVPEQPARLELEPRQRRTLFWTESRALVLSLPISMAASFAGFEPACSIRLIVPRNMRILAKLTSRRLTFAAEQLGESAAELELAGSPSAANYDATVRQSQAQPQATAPSLWLNVSQNPFVETQQRVIETEGNVLGFRFLLDRFAARQQPEIRFQVVLTAFQTLSDNSDNSQQFYPPAGSTLEPQFICDQQRLISSSLACDGYKNCQDGHDEEEATCLVLRNQKQQTPPNSPQHESTQHHQQSSPGSNLLASQNNNSTGDLDNGLWWWRFRHPAVSWTGGAAGPLLGLLLWLVLVLLLLSCCVCCVYLVHLLLLRRRNSARRRRQLARGGAAQIDHSNLAAQNLENLAKLNKGSLLPPPPLQVRPSILKRAGDSTQATPTPQHHLLHQQQEPAPPPVRPSRGALSSRLAQPPTTTITRNSPSQRATPTHPHQPTRPVPARRLTRPASSSTGPPTPQRQQPIGESDTTSLDVRHENEQVQHLFQQQKSTSTQVDGSPLSSSRRRVTTYHYSFGSTRMTESYLERLSTSGGTSSPSRPPSRPPSYRQLVHTGTRLAGEPTGGGQKSPPPPASHESSALI